MMRQGGLIQSEMNSIQGPSVRARVERGGHSVIELSSDGPTEPVGGGFFSVAARRDDGATVAVYVPNEMMIPDGSVIEVVRGQHGYYFRSLVSTEQP
jgi:hypothetical protein